MTALALTVKNVRRIDTVYFVVFAIFLLIGLVDQPQLPRSATFLINALWGILPFLAASVFIAGAAKATGLDQQIALVFKARPVSAIIAASFVGALAPFCSCGVIPLIAALLAAGVPLAPVMSIWLASPLMDPSMFLLTAGVFGTGFAVAKTIAAISIGLIGGFATHVMVGRGMLTDPLRASLSCGGCGAPKPFEQQPVVMRFWTVPERRQTFSKGALESGLFLFKWLTLAFLLESLMVAYVPAEAIGQWLGGASWWAIPASVIVGVPSYLNGFAAIPTVSALMDMGMAPGAAMGFMLAGGVTSIPAALAVFALVKRPVFAVYLLCGLLGSLALSYAVQPFLA